MLIFNINPISLGGGKDRSAATPRKRIFTHQKSMGRNSDSEFFYIPKCISGTLGTICHGQKTGDH